PSASSIASRPSFAASGMYGPSSSRSSARITGMLTALVTTAPSSAAATCSATIRPARSCASAVEAARCGVTTTLSSSSSGPEYGSSPKTSSAAAATLPERSASASASSSTSSPRAALTSRTPSRVGELAPAPAAALPPARLQRAVRLRDVAGERQQEPDRVLRRRDDRRLRRVRDDDPAPRRRLDVDVVDPDARAADHLQALAALDQ